MIADLYRLIILTWIIVRRGKLTMEEKFHVLGWVERTLTKYKYELYMSSVALTPRNIQYPSVISYMTHRSDAVHCSIMADMENDVTSPVL